MVHDSEEGGAKKSWQEKRMKAGERQRDGERETEREMDGRRNNRAKNSFKTAGGMGVRLVRATKYFDR